MRDEKWSNMENPIGGEVKKDKIKDFIRSLWWIVNSKIVSFDF